MAPRYIAVVVPGRDEPLSVRVVTRHPEDDAMNRQLYRVEGIWDWCDAQTRALQGYTKRDPKTGDIVWVTPTISAENVDKTADTLAGVRIKRDEACRDLFKMVLSDKMSGEQVEEVLYSCDVGTVTRIFEAAKGIDPEAITKAIAELTKQQESPVQSSEEPTAATTPSAS